MTAIITFLQMSAKTQENARLAQVRDECGTRCTGAPPSIPAHGGRTENIRQTLSPAIVATPQIWGYHIAAVVVRPHVVVVATPHIWGYHVVGR